METVILQNLKKVARHSYMRLLVGIILIFTGVWVYLFPTKADIDFSIPFALAFLFIGIIEIAYAAFNMKNFSGWGWLLAGGITDVLISSRLAWHPQIFMTVLPVFISFIILLRSFMAIIWFVELRKRGVKQMRVMLICGILGILAAVIIFFNHTLAGLRFVQGTSAAFIVIGIFEIYLSFCLKKLPVVQTGRNTPDQIRSDQ